MTDLILCAPSTSVSMTINGPAPIILAMFMNTAIDQQVRIKEEELGRPLTIGRIYGSERMGQCKLFAELFKQIF